MKRGLTVLLSLVFLASSGVLLWVGECFGQGVVQTMAETVPEGTSVMPPSPSLTREAVPVTTVREAWDEEIRKIQRENVSPEPVTVSEDAVLEFRNETGYEIDLKTLPALPTIASSEEGNVQVLIMHTHGSESYDEGTGSYRSQDETKSVIAVGEVLRQTLEERGYGVIHDRTLCDYPEYNGAYNRSRAVIQEALEKYPSIALVLDIHRDAVEDENGRQMRMACQLDGQEGAQLMLVVGTDAGGLEHPSWRVNLALAVVMQLQLGQLEPNLMRPLNLRTERFNQDLAPMTLLVEVGASGNTLNEAKISAKRFGEVLSDVLDACSGKSS